MRKLGSILILLCLLYSIENKKKQNSKMPDIGNTDNEIFDAEAQEKMNKNIQIKEKQKSVKQGIHIQKTNFKHYNFPLVEHTDFIIRSDSDQTIKAVIDVYWKQNNVYMLANVKEAQKIHIVVLEEDKQPMFSTAFYTSFGFHFKAKANKYYRLMLQERGSIQKIIMMRLSQSLVKEKSKEKSKEKIVHQNYEQIDKVTQKMKNALGNAGEEWMLTNRMSEQIYLQTSIYSNFHFLQMGVILLVSCLQVRFITRLFKSESIV